ncbi:MAG: nucleotidyl transferase AbiEii/AbiGii toxin family protein [Candidatus Micrarchaeota archaeon]
MDLLTVREREIFEALRLLREEEFAIIGGYAANAYAPARFSVDCDLVIKDRKAAERIAKKLESAGFLQKEDAATGGEYAGSFIRLEKTLEKGFKASFDLLIMEVYDRRSGISFSAEWVFLHSKRRRLKGKTFTDSLETRIINPDALAAMKLVCARASDLRDVFMLLPQLEDSNSLKRMIAEKAELNKVLKTASQLILSKEFKRNLEGVFGFIDERVYRKHIAAFEKLMG